MSDYRHGTIWLINFEPQVGTEIKKVRPGFIVSKTGFNQKRFIEYLGELEEDLLEEAKRKLAIYLDLR